MPQVSCRLDGGGFGAGPLLPVAAHSKRWGWRQRAWSCQNGQPIDLLYSFIFPLHMTTRGALTTFLFTFLLANFACSKAFYLFTYLVAKLLGELLEEAARIYA